MAISVPNGALTLSADEQVPAARKDYRPDIDGLRAIAALGVVGHHTGVLLGGFIGVDIFFVISGYLISALIFRALARGSFSSPEFYARRVRRIFPALIVLLIAAAALGWLVLLSDDYQLLGRDIVEGSGFIRNFPELWPNDSNFHASPHAMDLGHLWSLGVEEQFYLVWPLFLMLVWKLKGRQSALIVGLTATSFIINIVEVYEGVNNYSLPWARLWQLSLGGALAHGEFCGAAGFKRLRSVSTSSFPWVQSYNHHVCGLVGMALLVVPCVLLKDGTSFPGWRALAPTLGAVLVISAGANSWVNRYVLGSATLVSIGLISYPIYLWHYIFLEIPPLFSPQITPTMKIAAVAATFIFSYITYRYVELPLRRASRTMLVAGALGVGILACGILGYLIAKGEVPARTVPSDAKRYVLASREDWLPGTRGTSWTQGPDQLVTLRGGVRLALYIGDSNVQQYYSRIEKVLADHPLNSRGAVFAAQDWCAPVDSDIPDSYGATSQACRNLVHKAFEYAGGSQVDTVVISACWRCYFLSLEDSLGQPGKINSGADQAIDGLQREIERLVQAGKQVYLVLGIPVGPDLDPRSMIHPIILPPGFRVVFSAPRRSDFLAAVEPIRSRLIKVAQVTGARIIDPMQSLCDETTCSPVSVEGAPVYRDSFDLSPTYVRDNVRYLDKTVLDAEATSR